MKTPFNLVVLLLLAPTCAAGEWEDFVAGLGNLVTVAGGPGTDSSNGNEWWEGYEGGSALVAELSEPHMAMDDMVGNIYIADKNAHAIRKVTPQGLIVTVAGRHRYLAPNTGGYDGDGVATQRLLSYPNGLYVLPDGTVYFLETGDGPSNPNFPVGQAATDSRIRRLDRNGAMTTLLTDTPLTFQRGLWVSPDESFLYYTHKRKLRRWTASNPGNIVTLLDLTSQTAADFANIDVDRNGDVLVTDRGRHYVYRVPAGSVGLTNPAVVAGNGLTDALANSDTVFRDGSLATQVPMDEARGIAFHPLGGYLLACHKGGDLWHIDASNVIHSVIQGRSSQAIQLGEGQPITADRALIKIAEPRSVRVGWRGDIIICTNDSGFIRVVRSVVPAPVVTPALGPGPVVSWPGTAGRRYFLERSNSPAGPWVTLDRRLSPGNTLQSYFDPFVSTWQRACYRVHEHRAWP